MNTRCCWKASAAYWRASRIHWLPGRRIRAHSDCACNQWCGGNRGSILTGIALIGASFLFPGAGLFGTTSIFGANAVAGGVLTGIGTLGAVGASLVLTGIAGIISPVPKTPEMDSDPRENFNFSGVQNTSRSGVVVPVIYGEVITGSITISAG